MGVFDFLSCSFGSVFGGFITSIIISCGLVLFSAKNTKKGSLEPLPVICGFVLFCLLFFQTTLMYAAIGSKGIALDFVSACNLQFGGQIDGEELKQQMVMLIQQNPVISFFIDYGDLEDFDWSQPIKSLRAVIGREYNYYILRRIAWIVVYILILGSIIVFSSFNGKKSGTRHARTGSNNRTQRNFDRDYF